MGGRVGGRRNRCCELGVYGWVGGWVGGRTYHHRGPLFPMRVARTPRKKVVTLCIEVGGWVGG